LFEWECFNPKTGRWYNNYDRAIQWSDGQLVRIQIAVDITRIKELEEERQRNEQSIQKARQIEAIGTLAGGMAHDFNNLLQVIVGNLSLLEFQTAPSHGSADHVHAIHTACAKATQLANRLITFSAGGSPHRVLMAITPLLQTIALAQTRETGIVCDFNLSEALWPTTIDQDQISLVFENLISNARESMNNTGRLVIATSNFTQEDSNTPEMPPGRYVQITIKDNGCGIPEREIPKIFEPYYSTKVRNAQKGMGLGLSIAYSIVRKHYGTIDLQSTPGVGTTVNIYLPTGATDA
jgi:signal transduction histidine kinase